MKLSATNTYISVLRPLALAEFQATPFVRGDQAVKVLRDLRRIASTYFRFDAAKSQSALRDLRWLFASEDERAIKFFGEPCEISTAFLVMEDGDVGEVDALLLTPMVEALEREVAKPRPDLNEVDELLDAVIRITGLWEADE